MVKDIYVSYPCITREYGGYNMYPPLLLGRALTTTFTLTCTFIKTLNFFFFKSSTSGNYYSKEIVAIIAHPSSKV